MDRPGKSKRPRALQACKICRVRKNRCSEDRPCTYCVEHDLECTYSRTLPDKRQRLEPAFQVRTTIPGVKSSSPNQTLLPGSIQDDSELWSNNLTQMGSQDWPARMSSINASDQVQQRPPTSTLSAPGQNTSSSFHLRNAASDVMDTNLHTKNLEFYGSSSSVAFLRRVETLSNTQTTDVVCGPLDRSLASRLHNTEFQPNSPEVSAPQETTSNPDAYHFRVAQRFLDAYFSNIHNIQPLFEEEEFLARCEDLWFNRPEKQPLSFVALYYATLSLGSLVMTFESPMFFGGDRFTWSRKLFNQASALLTRLGTATDIEMVQCFYMMSKICQHELNPHVAYLYSGQAARTSLAIGINRRLLNANEADPRASIAASKTWWATYCLDIQTSFALGRPDSLGPDQYHTQWLPTSASNETLPSTHVLQIVPCMVELSRIMRKVGLDLYTQSCSMGQKLRRATELDAELQHWLEQVPPHLRFEGDTEADLSLRAGRLPSYMKKQSVVLRLRYLNLQMIMHAVSMTQTETVGTSEVALLQDCRCRCLNAAESAIGLMYETFRTDNFFQTWWYNATYSLFAVSILLSAVFHQIARTQQGLDNILLHIERAIMVLQAMDECMVAKNATAIIKRTLSRARKVPQPSLRAQRSSSAVNNDLHDTWQPRMELQPQPEFDKADKLLQLPILNGSLDENISDLECFNSYSFNDNQQALFWTEWAHELDGLGT